jgi:hypothetical protein
MRILSHENLVQASALDNASEPDVLLLELADDRWEPLGSPYQRSPAHGQLRNSPSTWSQKNGAGHARCSRQPGGTRTAIYKRPTAQ